MRLKSGEATLADAEQLMDWRRQSSVHELAFRDAVKCWHALGEALATGRPGPASRRRRSPGSKARS